MDEEAPITDKELSSQLTGLNKGKSSTKNKIILIGGISIIVLMIIIIIIVIATSSSNSEEKKIVFTKQGEINCVYDVRSISKNTQLLSNEFIKNSNFDIEIDGQIIKYSKEYRFKSITPKTIKFILYDPVSMDFMFKDVPDLQSVEMVSENNLEIKSMASAFEDCQNLRKFNISGFDTSKVTSMKKLFYRTSLSEIDLSKLNTKNVKDMSYMFASTEIIQINITTMDTSNVETMASMFQYCRDLISLDLSSFNTENVKDMSYMFFFLQFNARNKFIWIQN